MKSSQVRELVVSSLFSTCVVGLLAQFLLLERHLEFTDKFASALLQHSMIRSSSSGKLEPPMPVEENEEGNEGGEGDEDDDEGDEDGALGPAALRWSRMEHESSSPGLRPPVVHVGIIMKNIARNGIKSFKLRRQFVTTLVSVLENARTLPLHLVVLTDDESVPLLRPLVDKFVSKLARVEVETEYFEASEISYAFLDEIMQLRAHFTSSTKAARKYADHLFMMAPFYHRVFPYDRLIMLDADLRFKIDIAELYSHFDRFEKDEVMGLASDLTPHYKHVLRFYRQQHPGTHVGEPGRFQGFNTGVVLFNLSGMRSSDLYRNATSVAAVTAAAEKYKFHSHLGDQCMFSLIGLEHPELFHLLPCEYNFQMDVLMATQKEFAKDFLVYHYCRKWPKIYHGNGGAQIPMNEVEEEEMFGDSFLQRS